MTKIMLPVLLAALAFGCKPEKNAGNSFNGADSVLPVNRRVVFCLSMLSNIPAATAIDWITDSGKAVSQIVQYAGPVIDSTLLNATDSSVPGDTLSLAGWSRICGPAVIPKASFPIKVGAQNIPEIKQVSAVSMTIFRDNNFNYVLAVQATNPYCPYAWDTLDFNVSQTVPWTYTKNNVVQGFISLGTSLGLSGLLQLKDNSTGFSMQQFLDGQVKSGNNVIVTGHSLGGARALYLNHYYTYSVTKVLPNLYCLSTVGATPGDAAFANYYNSKLQNNTVKLWNQYDVIPDAWGDSLVLSMASNANGRGGIYAAAGNSLAFDPAYTACNPAAKQPVPFTSMATSRYIDTLIGYAPKKAALANVVYTPLCGGGASFAGAGARSSIDSMYVNVVHSQKILVPFPKNS